MPACVTATISIQSFSLNLDIASRSAVSADLNGSVSFHSGCCGAIVPKRCKANIAWVYNGCSVQRVPSWSNVAMRSFGSTNLGLDFSVVSLTKARIACFAGPLFHEGSGSSNAWDSRLRVPRTAVAADTLIRSLLVIFIGSPLRPLVRRNGETLNGNSAEHHRQK